MAEKTAAENDLRESVERAVSTALDGPCLDALQKKVEELATVINESVYDAIRESLADDLSHFAQAMAEGAVEALLAGDEAKMRRYLKCAPYSFTGRGDDGIGPEREQHQRHPVIHGTLFESGPIAIRRKIAEAHRDLITDERIKDLEEQVKSLVAQVAKAEAKNRQLCERGF